MQASAEDPLRRHASTVIRVVGSRCPHCAWDQSPDRRAWARICPNCHSALLATRDGFARCDYSHVRREDAPDREHGYFPFWRFGFAVSSDGASRAESLEDLLPRVGSGGPRGSWIWLPALRMLGDEVGDATFARLAVWASRAALECVEDRIPTGERAGRLIHARLPLEQAEACARSALIAMYEPRDLRGVRPRDFRERFADSRLELGVGRLVMVPAVFERNRCRLPGLRPGVPEIILRGRMLSGREH